MSLPKQTATAATAASKYATIRSQIERDRLHPWSSAPTFMIGNVEVAPMTLRSMIDLELSNNAFIVGNEPTAGDIAAYIWRHHPKFGDEAKRKAFIKSIANADNVDVLIADIFEHYGSAFEESPAASQFGGTSIDNRLPPIPAIASVCYEYGSTFGVDPREVADIDLRIVFQSCRAIRIQNGAKYSEPKRLRSAKSEFLKYQNG
jgi:hypothetical protein